MFALLLFRPFCFELPFPLEFSRNNINFVFIKEKQKLIPSKWVTKTSGTLDQESLDKDLVVGK